MSDININISLAGFGRLWNQIVTRFSHLSTIDFLFIIAAVFVPPLAVFLKVGLTVQLFINVVLTILGFVPGQIHALWVVLFLR